MAEKFTQTNVGTVYVYPNADILPETGWSAEIGVKQGFRLGSWQGYVDAVGFKTRYDQMMEFSFGRWANSLDPNALFGLGFKSLNIGAIDISGAEFSLAADGTWGNLGIQMLLGYTYMNPTVLNPEEVYAQGQPFPLPDWYEPQITYYNSGVDSLTILKYRYRHLAKADVQLTWKNVFLGGSLRYNSFMENVDRFFESELFSSFVPGIAESRAANSEGDWVMDFRVGFSFLDRYRVALLIDNVNNREVVVRPAMYGPPRRITLQLKAQF
jgi:iron complex outermembrane receptor protein